MKRPARSALRLPGAIRIGAILALAVAAGCGMPASRKPALYQVRGRVVDAETKQGVSGARVLLRAALRTGIGTQILSSYGVADADGNYSVELSEPFETIRHAAQIRIDVSKRGYAPGGTELPPPAAKERFLQVPDIVLGRAGGPAPPSVPLPAGILPRAPTRRKSPLPWK